ncbi:MAG TPA: VOC family protein [Thermoanaerobaculia bacterium]|nr:VOC family protein [Thermoanaerobaculia bacterium]
MADFEPYLIFDGNCAEAVRFYEKLFGAKITMIMTNGESPMADQMPAEAKDRVLHARLVLNDRALMASDAMLGEKYEGMQNFAVSQYFASLEEGQRVWDALAEGGQIRMPFQQTFWSERFGMLADRFGTPWMISAGKPAAM